MPVLLTYDVHVHSTYCANEVERFLEHVLELHAEDGLKASFLFPAEAARCMKGTVRKVIAAGHEVGCHGLTHRHETYNSMSTNTQVEKLRRATREIEDVVQRPVTVFRAPVFKISGATLRILEELGYEADLSMNSQRLGVFSSDVGNFSWMISPRRPYHPDFQRPWRKGTARLWEIPLSCILVPFMSNTGLVFGLAFMKTLFRILYVEASHSRKPVVYMLHPEDRCARRRAPERQEFRLKDLVPTREHGLRIRSLLYERDPVRVTKLSEGLLQYMHGHASVFLTVQEYVRVLNGEPAAWSRGFQRGGG